MKNQLLESTTGTSGWYVSFHFYPDIRNATTATPQNIKTVFINVSL